MITLEQAKAAALEYAGEGLEICMVSESPNRWVFDFRYTETKDYPDTSPVGVDKETGKADEFFPPDHPEEFDSLVVIEGDDDDEEKTFGFDDAEDEDPDAWR